jgi:hypothetical protein
MPWKCTDFTARHSNHQGRLPQATTSQIFHQVWPVLRRMLIPQLLMLLIPIQNLRELVWFEARFRQVFPLLLMLVWWYNYGCYNTNDLCGNAQIFAVRDYGGSTSVSTILYQVFHLSLTCAKQIAYLQPLFIPIQSGTCDSRHDSGNPLPMMLVMVGQSRLIIIPMMLVGMRWLCGMSFNHSADCPPAATLPVFRQAWPA